MIIKEEFFLSCFNTMRTLHIYLPDTYRTSTKKYPVLYMFDGHNLFKDEDATFGKCWGLEAYLNTTNTELIVVGIECNHDGNQRLEEFSPYDFHDRYVGSIHGRGAALMEWVVTELKTHIDTTYRTKPGRNDTAIAGSSMGGLMALYTILHHNDTFSKAACLSPFLAGITKKMDCELQNALAKQTRIYISWGSDEFRTKAQLAKTCSYLLDFQSKLTAKGIHVLPKLIVKGRHDEASWEKELPTFIPYVFEKN